MAFVLPIGKKASELGLKTKRSIADFLQDKGATIAIGDLAVIFRRQVRAALGRQPKSSTSKRDASVS